MEPRYEPQGVEERWQRTWEEEGLYKAGAGLRTGVVRDLHPSAQRDRRVAHGSRSERLDPGPARFAAPDARLQHDLAARLRPRRDRDAERDRKELAKEGTTRHDLGREAFVERTWAWLEKYGGVIMGQLRRLGASLDYRRERMTMDEGYVRAVMKWFVHLHERGASTGHNRIVNWCPRCATAISDLEVVPRGDRRHARHVRYPLGRRLRPHQDRDGASADDARRRGRRRAPGR